MKTTYLPVCCWLLALCLIGQSSLAQTITGAWKGKIGNVRTELKLVKKGDSLLGTAYYYTSRNNFRRYAVRGYFDGETNDVVWWDEELLEDKGNLPGNLPVLAVADFNCPGDETMKLDGSSTERDHKEKPKGPVALEKENSTTFRDEWDFVIENYTVGANHPDIIDSIARLSFTPPPTEIAFTEKEIPSTTVKPQAPMAMATPEVKVPAPAPVKEEKRLPISPMTPTDKFTARTNKLQTVIPITSKKIELRFYDNAQVDGDSIALFLNGKLIFEHIRLTEQAYTIFLNADDLSDDNELVMVAENLGSIPPNTSYMKAIVGRKEYEARLYADEKSSALIRLIKQDTTP